MKKFIKQHGKKIIGFVVAILMIVALIIPLAACNMQVIDTTWSFERAIIFLPDGDKIEGKVSSWTDFESSDMIQVTIEGKTYMTHSSNVVMISE